MDLATTATSTFVTVPASYLAFLQEHFRECPQLKESERAYASAPYSSPQPPQGANSSPQPPQGASSSPQPPQGANSSPQPPQGANSSPQPPKEANSKKRKRVAKGAAKPDNVLQVFLKGLPKPSDWAAGNIKFGGGIAQYSRILRSLISESGANITEGPSQEKARIESNLVAVGIEIAQFIELSLKSAELQQAISCFQLLVLLSYCSFLSANKIAEEEVDKILQEITTIREKERRRLVIRATRINKFIRQLVQGGWCVYRATELFFINALSLKQLLRIRDESFETLLDQLLKDEYVKNGLQDCLNVQFSIPSLIKYRLDQAGLGHEVSIDKIYADIGYKALTPAQRGCAGIPHNYATHQDSASVSAPQFQSLPPAEGVTRSGQHHASGTPSSQATLRNARALEQCADRSIENTPRETVSPSTSAHRTSIGSGNVEQRPIMTPTSQELVQTLGQQALPIAGKSGTSQEGCRSAGLAPNSPFGARVNLGSEVPDTASSIEFAIHGNIGGLQHLFSHKLAFPNDVSHSRGFSLVRWALYGGMRNYKTVQFLLSCGALVDEESYQHVWDYAYRQKCSPTELHELQCIMMDSRGPCKYKHWADDQEFPLIHQIIFRRKSKSLSDELNDNPNAVHEQDAMGRTALDWATALGQLSDMQLLIASGSHIDTMDKSGRTTVLHAVDSHNDDALRIILEAGANPNPEVPIGLFRSSPLIAASFGGLAEMVRLLLKFGAKVDAYNPEGRTALLTVASTQDVECANILLACGADPGFTPRNGHSPLTMATKCNSHTVLKLFLDRCVASRPNLLQFLFIIAESADAETMSILAASDLLTQTLLNPDDFAAYHQTLRSRTDYDENLGNAFEQLLIVVARSSQKDIST